MHPSIIPKQRPTFHWADYVIFALFLCATAGIGVVVGYSGKKKKKQSTKDFLMGGREMHWLAVGVSLQATFLSAITLLGIPSEMYLYGTMYVYVVLSHFVAFPVAGHLYMPIYHKLNITSAYEYLELRFNKAVRLAGSIAFIIMIILYMAVVLYAPSLALSQVTGLPVSFTIVTVGLVCTFYTAAGGMKATIWNDTMQMGIMTLGLVLLLIFGLKEVGGLATTMEIAEEHGRLIFDQFSPDLSLRTTFWSQVFSGTFVWLALFAPNQSIIQKYNSVEKLEDAKKAPWLVAITFTLGIFVLAIIGLVMFAYFHKCDPLSTGEVESADQLIPLFVMYILGRYPGLPGFFLSSVFSASLSSISGGLTALAAVCYIDFILPCLKSRGKSISESRATLLTKGLSIAFGFVNIVCAYLIGLVGGGVLQLALGVFGMVGSPLLGVITCALFIPWVNSKGALAGIIVGTVFTSWIAIGNAMNQFGQTTLSRSTDGCPVANVTNITTTMPPLPAAPSAIAREVEPALNSLYRITYFHYSWIGCFTAILVSLVGSLVTGWNNPKEVDSRLVYPIDTRCCCCCPPRWKDKCITGVHVEEKEEKMEDVTETEKKESAMETPVKDTSGVHMEVKEEEDKKDVTEKIEEKESAMQGTATLQETSTPELGKPDPDTDDRHMKPSQIANSGEEITSKKTSETDAV